MSDFIQGLVAGAVLVGVLLILGSLAMCWIHRAPSDHDAP